MINSTTNTKNSKKQETNNLFVAQNTKAMEKFFIAFFITKAVELRLLNFFLTAKKRNRKLLVFKKSITLAI